MLKRSQKYAEKEKLQPEVFSLPTMSRYKKRVDFESLRNIPIIEVAELLGMDLKIQNSHNGEWALRDGTTSGVTSLVIFEKTNTWKRFSGKDNGSGVHRGSPIDLVMHMRGVDLKEAAQFLTTNFL